MTTETTTPTAYQIGISVTDPDAIASMAGGPDAAGRLGVAANGEAGAEVIRILAHDADPAVRLMALIHPRCPETTRAAQRDELPALVDAGAEAVTASGGDAGAWRRAVEAAIARW